MKKPLDVQDVEALAGAYEAHRHELTKYDVALHEAGHAVMAVFLRIGVERVVLVWPEINGSQCEHTLRFRNRVSTKDELMLYLAGQAATAQGSISYYFLDNQVNCGDLDDMYELIEERFPDKKKIRDVLIVAADVLVWHLVNTKWMQAQIHAIADALMRRGSLSGRQVRNICRKHCNFR